MIVTVIVIFPRSGVSITQVYYDNDLDTTKNVLLRIFFLDGKS